MIRKLKKKRKLECVRNPLHGQIPQKTKDIRVVSVVTSTVIMGDVYACKNVLCTISKDYYKTWKPTHPHVLC